MTRAANLSKIVTDANLEGTLDVTGVLTGTSLDISGNIDVDGITNLDVVDIDGAVDMASTLTVAGAFTSLGIDDNANAVAITIDSSEQIGIGTTSPSQLLHLKSTTNAKPNLLIETENAGANGGRLDFLHKSSSPADGDLLGDITFGGYSDDGTPPSDFARYVMIKAFAADVSNNAEKGRLSFSLHNGASNENNVDVLTLNGDKTGIGTTAPDTLFHLSNTSGDTTMRLTRSNSASTGNNFGTIEFENSADTVMASIKAKSMSGNTECGLTFSSGGGNTERMRLDNSGNLGIGLTAPTSSLHVLKNSGGEQTVANFSAHNYGDAAATYIQIGTEHGDGSSRIGSLNNPDSSGGNTSALTFQTHNTSSGVFTEALRIRYHGRMNAFNCTNGNGNLNVVGEVGSSSKAISFAHTTNGGEVGSIKTASSSTNYDTSSDYRLKENVIYDFDATSRLKQLKPVRFNFKIDKDKTVDGFLAHEVSSIVPNAISGEKDGVQVWEKSIVGEDLPDGISVGDNILDDNGNTIPDYQSIDHSKIVPLLTKALQEQQATIEALTARIVTLENA